MHAFRTPGAKESHLISTRTCGLAGIERCAQREGWRRRLALTLTLTRLHPYEHIRKVKRNLAFLLVWAMALSQALGQSRTVDERPAQQSAQSLSFLGPSNWNPGTTVNVDAFVTYSGYSALGLEYWLEVPSALAPFVSITGVQYFTFTIPHATSPNPALFNSTSGATPGYNNETRQLGASTDETPGSEIPPGSYYITRLTFAVDAGAASLSGQTFTMRSTTVSPRISEVTDSQFNDHNIIPAGSFNITVGPVPCAVVAQVSRKAHGVAGSFDVDLPLTGVPGIESRTGGSSGDHTIVVTFSANVAVNGNPQAAVTSGTGTIGSDGSSNGGMVVINGNTVTIPLTNVANAQTINVTLNGANCGSGNMNLVIPMSVLVGDTTHNGIVNSSDIAQTKGQVGNAVTASNFRGDVTVGGSINGTDVSVVKANLHTALP